MENDARELVKKIQASMVESAKTTFEESGLDSLCCLIRLTVEFCDYLHNGIPDLRDITERNQHRVGRFAQSDSDFNELKYSIESIFSGIELFTSVNAEYSVLVGATSSQIKWGTASMVSLEDLFLSMFHEFTAETNFEKKCRLLLDLFKIQIVFAGVFYD